MNLNCCLLLGKYAHIAVVVEDIVGVYVVLDVCAISVSKFVLLIGLWAERITVLYNIY